jgi:hypothetical protein
MSDLATGNGAPGWEWKGHAVRLLDGAALARYERRVFGVHLAELQALRGEVKEDDFAQQLALLREQKAAGMFSLRGPLGRAYLEQPDGAGAACLLELVLNYDGRKKLDGLAVLAADPLGAVEMLKAVARESGLLAAGSGREQSSQAGGGAAPPF